MAKKTNGLITVREFKPQSVDPNISYRDGIPIPENLLNLVDAYQLHPWVYSAVNILATDFASVEYKMVAIKDEKVEDLTHPFSKILRQPNPYMSGYDLREATSISLEMTGNAYWIIDRDGKGMPIEAWPVPSHLMKAVSSKDRMIDHYVYEIDGKKFVFYYEDVFHFKYHNPTNPIYGQSSVMAGRTEISADLFASMWNKNFFKNSGRPDAVLETDKLLDDNIRERTLRAWKKMHSGVQNAHRVAILEDGTKYKEMTRTAKDMDFINQRKSSLMSILTIFNVTPARVGVLEYANYSNMEQQDKIYWQMMASKIRKFEAMLDLRIRQMTFVNRTVCRAQLQHIDALRPNFKMMAETLQLLVNAGMPYNQAIDLIGFGTPHVDGGDVPRMPAFPAIQNQNEDDASRSVLNEFRRETSKDERKELVRGAKYSRFDAEVRERENRLQGKLGRYFRGQRRRVKKNFLEHADKILAGELPTSNVFFDKLKSLFVKRDNRADVTTAEIELVFDEGKEIKLMQGVVAKEIKSAYVDFAIGMGKKISPTFDFNLSDPVAIEWIENKTTKIVKEANAFTREQISDGIVDAIEDALAEGYSKNETINEIVNRIDEIYEFAVEGRAERIARTEIISASNAGRYAGLKMTGAKRKEWISTRDDRTRESHVLLDGAVVGITQDFVSEVTGAKLAFPGDPNAPASEIVNCRCTVDFAETEDEDRP